MMSDKGDAWMIEVLGDGTGSRHRRYLVGAPDRDSAVKAIVLLLGPDALVTSSTQLSVGVSEALALQPGEIKKLLS